MGALLCIGREFSMPEMLLSRIPCCVGGKSPKGSGKIGLI